MISPKAISLRNRFTSTEIAERCVTAEAENEALLDALEHCGYDPEDCIDCCGPPCNDTCRFWKLRHVLSYWEEIEKP